MSDLAIFAGRGALPEEISRALPDALVVSFRGVGIDFEASNIFEAEFEKSAGLFKALRKRGIKRICFAGAISRPQFNKWRMDMKTWVLMPKLRKALAQSDGNTLLFIRKLVEDEGFAVVGAHEIVPELVASQGQIGAVAAPELDLTRTWELHREMGRLDVGQALVMQDSLCLAIETLPGTRAMLGFVKSLDNQGGYLFKASKQGQDLAMDMASIGPDTIDQVKEAGLDGIFLGAGKTLILKREETINKANDAELFLAGV